MDKKRWGPVRPPSDDDAAVQWRPEDTGFGEALPWYDALRAAPGAVDDLPVTWTLADQRNGLVNAILDLQRCWSFRSELREEQLSGFSIAKLEYLHAMMLVSGSGYQPYREYHTQSKLVRARSRQANEIREEDMFW